MSLNIIATSPYAVYLSGDFRLFDMAKNSQIPDDFNIQKIIPIIRFRWCALVAYVGLAKYKDMTDVDVWLRQQLEKLSTDADVTELETKLLQFNDVFHKYNIRGIKHAFSVVGFEGRKPFSFIVSNFINSNGIESTNVQSELIISKKSAKHVEVFSSGTPINAMDKACIEKLLCQNANPQTIRKVIYETNVNVSKIWKTVSPECVTGYILASGVFEIGSHRIDWEKAYLPDFVIAELAREGYTGIKVKTDEKGTPLPPIWVGTTGKITYIRSTKTSVIISAYALRNVDKLFHDGVVRKGRSIFSRVHQENDPKYFSFMIH